MKRARLDPLRAVGYLRTSTDRQELSPEAQRAAVEAWAAPRGVVVVSWREDTASGASELSERPGLTAALADLRELRAGVLVVAKRDRLARDVGVALAVSRAVESMGAMLVAADGVGGADAGPSGELLRTLVDAFAQYERAAIRERTRAALAVRRAKGLRAGAVPWGYRLGPDGHTLEVEPAEAAARELAKVRRAEGRSWGEITAELASRGVLGRSGSPLGLTQVRRLVVGWRA